MSSKLDSLNKNLIFSYETQLCSKLNLDIDLINQNNTEIFNSLLNNFSSTNIELLYFMNKFLPKISNFNDICLRYFTSLIDSFKFHMNQKKLSNNKNCFYPIVLVLNSISNFIKIFSANQEKYNEKHKNVLKLFPQFLQLFFKLFQQKFEEILKHYNIEKKIIESFFIVCLTFIEYYPTLMRNHQNIIEKFIKNIFYNYIIENNIDKDTINISVVIYVNLYKLSPNMVNKHQDYIVNIINNIKYYMEFFRPKTIEEQEKNNIDDNSNILDKNNNLFFIDSDKNNKKDDIDNKNILQANKIIDILFNLLKSIFKYMACNIYFEINFNNIFPLFSDILNLYELKDNNKSNSSLSIIIFNGLSKTNYELFLINTNEKAIDMLIYLISNFSRYIYCYNTFFSKYINKILLNQKFFKNNIYTYNLHIKILSLFGTIISFYNHILPDEIELIIYKHLYNNLPILYLIYLQQNDKTLLKIDEVYFKASNIKNKLYSFDDNNNNELSIKDNHILLLEYFKILYNYCHVTKNINQLNYRNILGGIIDLIILPPFAKFIFNIDYDIKKIIIDIIEICLKRNLIFINNQKLFHFLNNFYFYDGDLKFNAEIVINLLQIKGTELLNENNIDEKNNNYYIDGIPNNITEQIFDFNKKIKEFLNDTYKKIEQIKSLNNEENKDENENNNKELNNNNIKDNEMLNKKRKIEDEEDIEDEKDKDIKNENENENQSDISERKGNKGKNKKNKNKNKKREKNNDNNNNKKSVENIEMNEENNEKNKEIKENKMDEEEIQIDEDIDIPDIV